MTLIVIAARLRKVAARMPSERHFLSSSATCSGQTYSNEKPNSQMKTGSGILRQAWLRDFRVADFASTISGCGISSGRD
jgi:hypothetical protein